MAKDTQRHVHEEEHPSIRLGDGEASGRWDKIRRKRSQSKREGRKEDVRRFGVAPVCGQGYSVALGTSTTHLVVEQEQETAEII